MTIKLTPLDSRIPKWDFNDLIERNCPICNSSNANPVYERPDHLNIKHCQICNLYFVSPSPSRTQLQTFYETYDDEHRRSRNIDPEQLKASYENTDPFGDLRIRELSSHLRLETCRVLDIGFGRAYFLYCLKRLGAIPSGLELDQRAIEFAKSLGIEDVYLGNLDDFANKTKYDLITMLDFVEHPLQLMDLLGKSAELLRPGGLLMIWTPNGDYAKFEESPITFRVDLEHMQYLSTETCLFIASKLDMRIIHLETLGFPALEGIDKSLNRYGILADRLKSDIKSFPGFRILNTIRHRIFPKGQDERLGRYHLFCIMQRSS